MFYILLALKSFTRYFTVMIALVCIGFYVYMRILNYVNFSVRSTYEVFITLLPLMFLIDLQSHLLFNLIYKREVEQWT